MLRGEGKRRGFEAVSDWLEGGLIFLKQFIWGHLFVRFCKGSCLCFCKWDYFYKIVRYWTPSNAVLIRSVRWLMIDYGCSTFMRHISFSSPLYCLHVALSHPSLPVGCIGRGGRGSILASAPPLMRLYPFSGKQ